VQDVIYLAGAAGRPMRSFLLTGGEINADNGGVIYSVNSITGNNVANGRVIGTMFNNALGNYVQNLNPYRNGVWTLEDTWHDLPGGTKGGATIGEIQAHLVGPVVLRRGNWHEFFVQTNAVIVANNAAETTLLAKGVGLPLIPANYLAPGTTVRGELTGVIGGKANAQIRVKLGSTVVLESDELTAPKGTLNLHFEISERPHGQLQIGSNLYTLTTKTNAQNGAALPIDVSIQWSAAAPEDSVKILSARIE
jgi:predicted secreted protein